MTNLTMILAQFANLRPADILYLQGDVNYTFLHLTNGKKLHSARTLKVFEQHFADQPFVRVHKTYLINPQHVASFGQQVCLSDGTSIRPSRRLESKVRRWLTNYIGASAPQPDSSARSLI